MATRVTGPYSYNAICDVCGFQYKSYELRKRWDGLFVCKEDWEVRHPLDFYRGRNDYHKLPFIRPNVVEVLLTISLSDPAGSNYVVGETVTVTVTPDASLTVTKVEIRTPDGVTTTDVSDPYTATFDAIYGTNKIGATVYHTSGSEYKVATDITSFEVP